MQIVIDIPEEEYNIIKKYNAPMTWAEHLIAAGTPLPKVQAELLDNIKAEIEQNAYPIVHGVNNHEKGMTLYGILHIIDKYKTESEKSMNNLCDLCLRDASQCKNKIEPCNYIPKYNLCPICKEKIIVYERRCYKCGYDFKAESEK